MVLRYSTLLILSVILVFIIQGCSPSDPASLVRQLNSKNQQTRDRAEETLKKIGQPAVEPLIQVLSHPGAPTESRQRAARILGEIKDERAIPALISTLGDIQVRVYSEESLKKLGAPATEQLVKSINNPDHDVQIGVIEVLGEMKEKKAIAPLTEIAMDEKSPPSSREKSREALKKITNEQLPIPLLLHELQNSAEADVRMDAMLELRKRKDPGLRNKVFDTLVKARDDDSVLLLLTWYSQEDSPEVKKQIVKTFARMGESRVLPVSTTFIKNEKDTTMAEQWYFSGSPILKSAAAAWIQKKVDFMNGELADQWLKSKSPPIRDAALNWAKGNFNSLSIEEYLNSPSPLVKKEALAWVKSRTPHLSLEEAEQWLSSPTEILKSQAMVWIRSVTMTVPTAERWLKSTNPTIRAEAENYIALVKSSVDRDTAQRWLNSGDPLLQSAAEEWAKQRGMRVEVEKRSR